MSVVPAGIVEQVPAGYRVNGHYTTLTWQSTPISWVSDKCADRPCVVTGLTTPLVDGTYRIQLLRGYTGDRGLDAVALLHEFGHVAGITYPDNAEDPMHSSQPQSIMYYAASVGLTEASLAEWAAASARAAPIHD